jgi:hypothetical protein
LDVPVITTTAGLQLFALTLDAQFTTTTLDVLSRALPELHALLGM